MGFRRVVAACVAVTAVLGVRSVLGDAIWDYEAVDALGYGTHVKVDADPTEANRVVIEGLVIGGTEDFVDRDAAFAMYSIWLQDDNDTRGGIQCWAGPWDKSGGWDAYPIIAAGSRVRVSGWLANHNGKVFMNDRHSAALLWTVEILDNDVGMPQPQLISDIGTCNYFDETRSGGAELYQTRWVELRNVEIIGGLENWGPDGEVVISDAGGADNLIMKLSLMGDFDLCPAPAGPFNVVGVFDQEDTNNDGDFHDAYRLWVKNTADITPVPEPTSVVLLLGGAGVFSLARLRRGRPDREVRS